MAGAALVALGCGVYGGPPPDEAWRQAHEHEHEVEADAGTVDTASLDAAAPPAR